MPIFAKRICQKSFQNLRMVLNILCNDKKICDALLLSYFGINVSQSIIASSDFFGEKTRWNFGEVVVLLSIISTASCFAERSFSVFWRLETSQRDHGRLSHLALLCIDHAEFFHLFSIRVLDQKTLVIYFESCGREP